MKIVWGVKQNNTKTKTRVGKWGRESMVFSSSKLHCGWLEFKFMGETLESDIELMAESYPAGGWGGPGLGIYIHSFCPWKKAAMRVLSFPTWPACRLTASGPLCLLRNLLGKMLPRLVAGSGLASSEVRPEGLWRALTLLLHPNWLMFIWKLKTEYHLPFW